MRSEVCVPKGRSLLVLIPIHQQELGRVGGWVFVGR